MTEEKNDLVEATGLSGGDAAPVLKPEIEKPQVGPSEGTAKVKYVGPEGQVCRQVRGKLEPGKTYEVSGEVAKSLVASSVHWQKVSKEG